MSVTAVPLRPLDKGTVPKLWIGLALVVLIGAALAWVGTAAMQYEELPSGVMMRTLEEGEGPTVGPNDLVGLEMTGLIEDGTIIHSSARTGQPDVVAPDQVIPGLRAALLRMRRDGVYHVIIPPEEAYGATPPAGSPIPPNETLEFRVRVLGILEGMAAMQGMMGGPGGPGGPGAPMPGQPMPGQPLPGQPLPGQPMPGQPVGPMPGGPPQ